MRHAMRRVSTLSLVLLLPLVFLSLPAASARTQEPKSMRGAIAQDSTQHATNPLTQPQSPDFSALAAVGLPLAAEELDLTTGLDWVQRTPANHPSPRALHGMAYDSARGVTVLFGGLFADPYSHFLDDTWEWDGTVWTQRTPANHPSGRCGASMAFDSARGVTVLFGGGSEIGEFSDTWEWDGTDWTQRTPANHPVARYVAAMAYDSARGVTVLFGGSGGVYDTWEWDGTDWTQRNPADHPSTGSSYAMAYDSGRGVAVLSGGWGGPFWGLDTWEWDGTEWEQRTPAEIPPDRMEHALACDGARGVTVLFGGYGGTTIFGDTWGWDGTYWVQRTPVHYPAARGRHSMVYDSARETLVLFGGLDGTAYFEDTWEYAWLLDAPSLAPIANPENDGDYLLDWSDVAGAAGYTLEEDDNANFTSPTIRYDGVDSQYQVTGQQGGSWYYRVRARNAYGSSPWSNIEVTHVKPAAPVLFPIVNPDGNGEYLVDWSSAIGATSYRLEEDDNPDFASPTERYDGPNSQYPITGQLTGLWYYRVLASNAGGDSPWSNTESVTVVPEPPVLYPISNPDGNGDYLVDWSSVYGATSYLLEEDDNPGFTSPTTRYAGPNSQYPLTGQQTGLWYYRVRASNAFGDSPWSNVESVGVVPAAPVLAPISNPDGNGDYLVDWTSVEGATSYRLEEDDNPGFSSPTERYDGPNSQYPVTGQLTGLWYYRVLASNAGGDSPWSNTESVTVVPEPPVLSPISNPGGDGNYLVDWSNVYGATSYLLEEDDNPEFASPATRYNGPDSQHAVIGQITGLWYYRVRASNAFGDSPWSNAESVSVVPSAPVLFAIDNPDGDGDYLVDWSDIAGATSYLLQEDDSPSFNSPLVRYTGADSQCEIAEQETGLWYYRVRASSAGGDGPWSNTESVGVVPAAPVLLPISNPDGNGDYWVDWSNVSGATSYRLQEDDNPDFVSPAIRYQGASSQYSVTGQPFGIWYYRVLASNAGGDSPWSNAEAVTADKVAPAAPILSPIYNPDGTGDYLVDWSDVNGAASYRLEEDDDPAFNSPTMRYAGEESQYQVIGQQTGIWYYRVRASNPYGDSPWSNIEYVVVLPAAPVLFAISNPDGSRDYTVDWSDVVGTGSYRLEEDDNFGFASPLIRYEGALSQYEVTGQQTGLWYYRVRASNALGDGPWSNIEFVYVVPDAPLLYLISNPDGDGEYVVAWSDVPEATSYRLEEDDSSAFSSPVTRYEGASSQYLITGQQLGIWHYRVLASNAAGDSLWSNTESVVVGQVLLDAPILYPISNPDWNGAYLVDWSDVTGATSYRLEDDDNPAFSSPSLRYTGATSQYQISGQELGTWYYRVRASNAYGDSPWSGTQSVAVGWKLYVPLVLRVSP